MKKIYKLIPAITSIGLVATPALLFVTSCGQDKAYSLKEMKVMKKVINPDESISIVEDFRTNVLRKENSSMTYIGLNEAFKLIKTVHNKYVYDDVYDYEIVNNYTTYVVKRENGAVLTIDPYYGTLTFNDYSLFLCEGTSKVSACARDYGRFNKYTDPKITSLIAWGDIDYRVRREEKTVINLSLYGIDMIQFKNELYLPFQTMSDIFLSDPYRPLTALKDIIVSPWDFRFDNGVTPTYPQIITDNIITVDQELLTYNYKETCLFMDWSYGLMSEKGVSTFDSLFKANGWKERMLKSATEFEKALSEVIGYFMDDGHSNLRWRSPNNPDSSAFLDLQGACGKLRSSERDRYSALRKTALGDKVPGYYVSTTTGLEDTAIITFDRFSNENIDYYASGIPATLEDVQDCIGLFLYSYDKISKNNNIKNVVVDISCNGGGDVKACMFISAMLAGGEFKNVFKTTYDDAINVCGYYADANVDGVINDDDFKMKDKNVYILSSTYSFSCANMLPTNLFQLPNCHVVGKRGGGGSCIVHPAASAIGTGFRMSGPMKHGYLKNGVFYYNDEGIEPEYYIDDNIYYRNSREDLIKYIHNIQ